MYRFEQLYLYFTQSWIYTNRPDVHRHCLIGFMQLVVKLCIKPITGLAISFTGERGLWLN